MATTDVPDIAQVAVPRPGRIKGAVPAGFTQTERKVATLYSPVDPGLLAGLLQGGGMPMGLGPQREVRVRMGKLEVWEKVQS
jgi:hypothetical protein